MDNRMKIYAFADEASACIDGQITAMKRNGLDGLEIRGVDGVNISDISCEKAAEVRRKLDDAGLAVWSIGSPIGKIGINDDFDLHKEKLRHTIELAHILGTENIRMFSFYIPDGENPELYSEAVLDRMGQMLNIAEGSGAALCHENEKGIYGDTAERYLKLLRAFPSLKGIFDPANFVQCDVDTLQAWELLAPHIFYMHIKDALSDHSVVPAGCGKGNLQTIVNEFIKQGGSCFTVEPHLTVFDGLAQLEHNESRTVMPAFAYPDNDTAFDAACSAFRKLL